MVQIHRTEAREMIKSIKQKKEGKNEKTPGGKDHLLAVAADKLVVTRPRRGST